MEAGEARSNTSLTCLIGKEPYSRCTLSRAKLVLARCRSK